MVFAKALPFARLAIGKPFTHGPQSLIASAHSWNATQTLQNRFKPQVGFRDARQDGLVDYYKEWQKIQRVGAWKQHQFVKRIEWRHDEHSRKDAGDESKEWTKRLAQLEKDGKWDEIPVVFEAMLQNGITPTTCAYNSLLSAAIQSADPLRVYADMLQRNVLPNEKTYSMLISHTARRNLEIALGLYEAATSIYSRLAEQTFQDILLACAENDKIPEMVAILSQMEALSIIPHSAAFVQMVSTFARANDIDNSIEMYNEYKKLAISNNSGSLKMDRRDLDIYAAMIRSFLIVNDEPTAYEFVQKLAAQDINLDAVVLKSFLSHYLSANKFEQALGLIPRLGAEARDIGLAAICIKSAPFQLSLAQQAFSMLSEKADVQACARALCAAHIESGSLSEADVYYRMCAPELANEYAVALVNSGRSDLAVQIGDVQKVAQITKSADFVALSGDVSLLGLLGPEEINSATLPTLYRLIEMQDKPDPVRFAHMLDLICASEPPLSTIQAVERSLAILDRQDLYHIWATRHWQVQDPYAATTDNKGSILITDLLERNLDEALNRFRSMRKNGRHPRFFTYSKLISAAAKEGRSSLAHEIFALAQQDVPYLSHRIVRHGWVSILDAMVAGCLQLGQRQEARQFHQQLLAIGSAPSSNTFGLYITTLPPQTFDEASEAVKIFLEAKSQGVEPTSFLYNALIGKLGKARRIDDCLFYFQEMRALGIRPTSVTYGTIVNALCRVSDEKFAEELFEEMENMPNYKPRPAPYHSMMQFFLAKNDRAKVLAYHQRMISRGIRPTSHTFKLLIDAHASIEPINIEAAKAVLQQIEATGQAEAVHYAALIHAHGCVAHNLQAARQLFDAVPRHPCIYQSMFESMVANHAVRDTIPLVAELKELTPYIANALIHGWASEDITEAERIYARLPKNKREPSTYEAMTRAYVVADLKDRAIGVVNEALAHGYPAAVANKIADLISTD